MIKECRIYSLINRTVQIIMFNCTCNFAFAFSCIALKYRIILHTRPIKFLINLTLNLMSFYDYRSCCLFYTSFFARGRYIEFMLINSRKNKISSLHHNLSEFSLKPNQHRSTKTLSVLLFKVNTHQMFNGSEKPFEFLVAFFY